MGGGSYESDECRRKFSGTQETFSRTRWLQLVACISIRKRSSNFKTKWMSWRIKESFWLKTSKAGETSSSTSGKKSPGNSLAVSSICLEVTADWWDLFHKSRILYFGYYLCTVVACGRITCGKRVKASWGRHGLQLIVQGAVQSEKTVRHHHHRQPSAANYYTTTIHHPAALSKKRADGWHLRSTGRRRDPRGGNTMVNHHHQKGIHRSTSLPVALWQRHAVTLPTPMMRFNVYFYSECWSS